MKLSKVAISIVTFMAPNWATNAAVSELNSPLSDAGRLDSDKLSIGLGPIQVANYIARLASAHAG